jgi:hypothetical protein
MYDTTQKEEANHPRSRKSTFQKTNEVNRIIFKTRQILHSFCQPAPTPAAGDCQPFVFSKMKVDFRDPRFIKVKIPAIH